jgi:ubiquinone/menaquinone biosynthesis C-methylase UbiE
VLRDYSIGCLDRLDLGPTDRVLDLATGPGTAALLAAERVPQGSVLGTDISDRFVEVATAATTSQANLRFARSPMEQLDLPDNSFDAASCVLGLMYAAPVEAALTELARVLAPGGRFASCVWGRRESCCFREIFPILGRKLDLEICPLFFALGAPGGFVDALERAGFVDVREERLDVMLSWRDDDEACAAAFDGGPGALPCNMFPDDVRQAVYDEYIASLEPFRKGAGFEAPAEFVYASAHLPS